jgi:hypothetical protein
VDLDDIIGRLPEANAVALRLHERGRDDAIAEQLGIAPQSVAALLRVAQAKLERLRASIDASAVGRARETRREMSSALLRRCGPRNAILRPVGPFFESRNARQRARRGSSATGGWGPTSSFDPVRFVDSDSVRIVA